MILRELTKMLIAENVEFVFIAEDGREFTLEQIDGKDYDNLGAGVYYVDEDYSSEYNDCEVELCSYDVILTLEELQEKRVIGIDTTCGWCTTIYIK